VLRQLLRHRTLTVLAVAASAILAVGVVTASPAQATSYLPIANYHYNYCINANSKTFPQSGTKIQLWESCSSTADQNNWSAVLQVNGDYEIQNKNGSDCLDVATGNGDYPSDGELIQLNTCANVDAELWYPEPFQNTGYVQLENWYDNFCIDVDTSSSYTYPSNGEPLILWTCDSTEVPAQLWYAPVGVEG
jgi:hypothetical protein